MPVALVVDDRQARLDTHADFLSTLRVQSLKAIDISVAKRIVAETPCVDFAIIDINFNPQFGGNKEGLEYGRQLKAQGYPAYLAAYSAYYADNESVMDEVRGVFDGILTRAPEMEDYHSLVAAARAKKIEFLERAALVHKGFIEQSPDQMFQFIELHDFHITNSKVLSDEYVEYIRSGYKIKLVEPVYNARSVGRSFLLWSKSYEGGVFLEVYKVPALFAYGDTEQEALKMLNEIIVGLYGDASKIDDELSSSSTDVWNFVKRLYEAV